MASALVEMRCRDVLIVRTPPGQMNAARHHFWGVVLATGTSERHCRASAEGLLYQLEQKYPGCDMSSTRPGKYSGRVESGLRREELTGWEVVDLTDPGPGLLVSIMDDGTRALYNLEEKWCLEDLSNVTRVELAPGEAGAEQGPGAPVRRVMTLEDLSREAEAELSAKESGSGSTRL